jgi:hypothetical protein
VSYGSGCLSVHGKTTPQRPGLLPIIYRVDDRTNMQ